MISLGVISLKRASAVQESRTKVREVVERLTGDGVVAARLAAAVSEMARRFVRGGVDPSVEMTIYADRAPMLQFAFSDTHDLPPTSFLAPFFSTLEPERENAEGRREVIATWSLSESAPSVTQVRALRALVEQKSRDELVGELQETNIELQRSFEDLRKTTSAKERMESELNIGRDIQMRMLPMEFPAFPNRSEFDVHAALHPAREVGGDFYDFFLIDEDRLCFGVGDVSGKGVPSALFMAMTKTLIKSRASNDASPASIMTHVNDEMAVNNESAMFVTIWLGILDLASGSAVYCNAGHNPPYLRRADGSLERLDIRHGPVVGAMEGMVYGESTLELGRGDAFLLYTDGVTEAMDPDRNLYEEHRLVSALEPQDEGRPEELVRVTVDDVWEFQADAEQADDITVLALQWFGSADGDERSAFAMALLTQNAEIARAIDAFEAFAEEYALSSTVRRTVNVVLDELLSNAIAYGFNDNEDGHIEIEVELKPDRLAITIADDGEPFNPFGSQAPNTDLSVEDRPIGGLGIHLVRKMMDEVGYVRQTNRNVVRLAKMLEEPTTEE
jgi:sigma-B regulation protein RsbU (phosphoserine phosphatase)